MSSIAKLLVAHKEQFKNIDGAELRMIIRLALDRSVQGLITQIYMMGQGHTIHRGRIHAGVILFAGQTTEQSMDNVQLLSLMHRVGAIKSFTADGWLVFNTETLDPEELDFCKNIKPHMIIDEKTEQEVYELFNKPTPEVGPAAAIFEELMLSSRPADVSDPTTGGLVGGRLHST